MAAAAYKDLVADLELPELLAAADDLRDLAETSGWKLVQGSIAVEAARVLQRLKNPTTKPEDVRYLQGLLAGLDAMTDAAGSIMALAKAREAEARKKLEHTHV